jgi:arylsulfatase A-like enzyme
MGATLIAGCNGVEKASNDRPNILWVILDDTGRDFSAYGNTLINTPVFDSLARKGVLFTNMHVTSPVCSPARSAMITGQYPTSNGTHHHRSSRGKELIFIDEDKPLVPELFKSAGYFTGNVGYDYAPKTDYNFIWNPSMYDVRHRIDENNWRSPWAGRAKDQPFFIQIQLEGGKNRRVTDRYPVEPDSTSPAPYYPDHALFMEDQASYHSSTLHVDKLLGDIMHHLRSEGLLENTVVMILGDNGQDNYRDKQWLYQGGTHVPFLIYGPQKYVGRKGKERDDLAIHIDMSAASLAMAGISIPDYFEGEDLFASDYVEREYIVTARDRCDWTQDRIRSVITPNFKYIRNFYPERPYMQSNYRDEWPMVIQAKEMFKRRELNAVQSLFFEKTRPAEELYVLPGDRYEVNNQIDNPVYLEEVEKMRMILDEWMAETQDQGEIPESEESYNEALKNVNSPENRHFPVIAGPSALSFKKDTAFFHVDCINVSNKTLDVDIIISATHNFRSFSKTHTLELQPDEIQSLDLKGYVPSYTEMDSIRIKIATYYNFNPSSGYFYSWNYTLKSSEKYEVPFTWISIDGNMSDWRDKLSWSLGNDDQVRFGVAHSEAYVFIGVEVDDDNVEVDPEKNVWQQDGIEIRLDARKEPYRSSGIGLQDFTDHLLLAMSPSERGKPTSVYLPAHAYQALSENFIDQQLRYICRKTDTGFVTEAAIPVSYLNNLQDGDWEKFRLNIIVHNNNSETEKSISWQPLWGSAKDFSGTGIFQKQGR